MTPTDELIAAPVGEWETTDEERGEFDNHPGDFDHVDFARKLIRDLDRALAYGKTQHNTAKLLASEEKKQRDQNKRLVEALQVANEAFEIIAGKRQCLDNLMGNRDVAETALVVIDAALAQPEEQR